MRKIKDKIISIMLAVVLVVTNMTVSVNAKGYESLPIDAQHFPDPEFRSYLSKTFDEDRDGYINPDDVEEIVLNKWDQTDKGKVKDLTGIDNFSNLTYLDCSNNQITDLKVNANLKLTDLNCDFNGIKELDVSKNTELEYISCDSTEITGLDLQNNKKLKRLFCTDVFMNDLDLSNNLELEFVTVSIDKLRSLNLTNLDVAQYSNPDKELNIYLYISDRTGLVDVSKLKGIDPNIFKNEAAYDVKTNKLDIGKTHIAEKTGYELQIDSPYRMYFEYYTALDTGNPYSYREISYRTHVQSYGWQGYATNGEVSGTIGQAKRLEAIQIKSLGRFPGDIQYTTHVQSYGWLPWASNGEVSGTEGEGKRLEAIKIKLSGEFSDDYDIYYRVHAQSYGWLGWAKNGEPAGTAGYGKRLEAIQILLLYKDEEINKNEGGISSARTEAYIAKPGNSPVLGKQPTSALNPNIEGSDRLNVIYQTHVQSYGWQGWKYNGEMAGTQGKAKRLEGIRIELTNQAKEDQQYKITYRTHVQSYGWLPWVYNGQMSGTEGQAKRLEAIEIKLEGYKYAYLGDLDDPVHSIRSDYDIYYRVHAQSYGWLGWAKNGGTAGTSGLAKRLEGIQIVLVPKGGAAPANNYGGITSVTTTPYIKK